MNDPLPTRLHAAADWWLRLREPNVPPATIAGWIAWCDADPANREAFAGVQSLWQSAADAPIRPAHPDELSHRPLFRRVLPWAAAGSVAAMLAWVVAVETGRIPEGAEVATGIGINREMTLADGTEVILGAASRLRTDYSADRRTVHLRQGEAYFQVRADKERPFVVVTPNLSVTAIGTAFNIRTDNEALRVTVSEGAVSITSSSQEQGSVLLRAGQQLFLPAAAARPQITAAAPQLATAWTTGTLQFMDEPLSDVIAVVNRYSPTAITLGHADLAEFRYTGTVVADRIEEWLLALPNSFPVEITRQEAGSVLIGSRD